MNAPCSPLRGGLHPDVETKLERLAALFAQRAGGVRGPASDVAREVCVTHPDYAPACWKLFDVWHGDGADDPLEALANYRAAGNAEAALLELDDAGQRRAIASEPRFRTRALALRLLLTDERLWHERPQSTLVTSRLALSVSRAARQDAPGPSATATTVRAYGRWVNALRIRGRFTDVRQHAPQLDLLTRQPVGRDLAEARWLLGRALFEIEAWDWSDAALRESIRAYWRDGRRFEARRARITRVMLCRAAGKPPERYLCMACRVFKAFRQEDVLREPTLFTGYRMNLPLYMVEAGALDEAEELWRATPPFAQEGLEVRRVGIGAVIGAARGETEEAEKTFRRVVQRFEDMGMSYDAGLFLLYLADLLLSGGRIGQAKTTLLRALRLFEDCQLKRHVAQVLDRLREALRLKDDLAALLRLAIERASGIVRRHEDRG